MLGATNHSSSVIAKARVKKQLASLIEATARQNNPIISYDGDDDRDYTRLPARKNITRHDLVAVKDNFVTSKLPTTCASKILRGFKGTAQSTVTHQLEQAGLHVVTKSNMDEFGMGSHNLNSAFGPLFQGRRRAAQSVGGSSGGSAVLVAGGLCRFAIGSDTGGSVRLPAAYTSIVGFKPSYGRISRNGLIPYANSLDTVGIMARSVEDVMSIYKVLNYHDPADPTSLSYDSRLRIEHRRLRQIDSSGRWSDERSVIRAIGASDTDESNELTPSAKLKRIESGFKQQKRLRRLRIGVPDEYNILEMHPYVRQAWSRALSALERQDHEIVPISLPTTRQALAAYYVLAPAEASSNRATYDGVRYGQSRSPGIFDNDDGSLYATYRGELFGEEVKRRILLGTFTLSAGAMDNYFIQAQKVRRLVQQDFNRVFSMLHPFIEDSHSSGNTVDLIAVPTAPNLPPLLSDLETQTAMDSYVNDIFTVPASLAGLPAISVPIVADENLTRSPDKNIGIQLIGQYGDDNTVLQIAKENLAAIDPPFEHHELRVWG